MSMCIEGREFARVLVGLADEAIACGGPENLSVEKQRSGGTAAEALSDHGEDCPACSVFMASLFVEGLRRDLEATGGP